MSTKELFVLAMNELKASYDFERNLGKTIEESFKNTLITLDFISPSYIIDHHELVIKLLEHITKCSDDTITWWMYETDFGRCDDEFKTITYNEDGRKVVLNTAEDLYRYIVDES